MSLKLRHLHKQKLITLRPLALLLWLFAVVSVPAAELTFDSGSRRVHLIELFTSQGCSSCPPAEVWMSKLKSEPRLWKDFVPLGFHVDYWDRLGWRDPFAMKEWTARQYQYSSAWKSEGVYTPGFVLDGRESLDRKVPASSNENAGTLKLSIANGKAVAEFRGETKDVDFHLAALGFDLTTKVTAGENGGRSLGQDFVVLSLTNQKMPDGRAQFDFNPDSRASAIAAWITVPNRLEPIQALGGWLR
jgi:hypothetical protein